MRIISDFKDYYDCIMRHGQADDLIYLRKRKEIDNKKFMCIWNYSWRPTNLDMESFVVGFCGKIYGVVKLRTDHRGEKKEATCISLEEIDTFVDQWFKDKEAKDYRRKAIYGKRHKYYWGGITQIEYRKWFNKIEENRDKHEEFFREQKCPIFVADRKKIEINGCLKDVDFFRIFDPYTAFQELQMWQSNQAEPRKPIPHISDADMLLAKGFDKKWSFRKPPQKSKKKSGRK